MVRYVTRWALTSGIRRMSGQMEDDGAFFGHDVTGFTTLFAPDEHYATLGGAIQEAKRQAAKKVEALQKQIKKFDDPNWMPKLPAGDK